MKNRKLLKVIGIILALSVLLGNGVFAAQRYSFSLATEQSRYTSAVKKTTSKTYANIATDATGVSNATVKVTVYDKSYNKRSTTISMEECSIACLSYNTKKVKKGTYLRLKIQNPATTNKGKTISVSGNWEP